MPRLRHKKKKRENMKEVTGYGGETAAQRWHLTKENCGSAGAAQRRWNLVSENRVLRSESVVRYEQGRDK